MNDDKKMIALLASHGATWEIGMRLEGGLTYQDIAATNIKRSVEVLAYYGDVETAAPRFAADPAQADNREALKRAAENGHEPFVRLMLRYQPDLARQITIARPAAMARLLFEHGMDPSRPNWLRITPLHQFAEHGDVESAALFIDHGADLHAREEEFCSTPLAWAANVGQTRMVAFLLQRGATLALPDDPPWATPLARATRRGHRDIVRLLTEYEQSGALPGHALEHYETLANALVSAYRSGDDESLQPIVELFQIERPLMWDRPPHPERLARFRRFVLERLGRREDGKGREALALADAQLLIARAHGFDSWSQLMADHKRGRG